MVHVLASNWWALALRGLAAIIFGILTFAWPGVTLTILALVFGAYALLDGIFSLIAAFRGGQGRERWWSLVIKGVLGVLVGIVTFVWTPITVVALVYVIAAWALITGMLELWTAFELRRRLKGEWMLILLGSASVLLGIALLAAPIAGAFVIAYWIGAYALVFGVVMFLFALRLRTHPRTPIPAGLA